MTENTPQFPREASARVSALIGMDWDEYLDALDEARRVDVDEVAVRGFKALMLAHGPEVCGALLRGERVPWQALDFTQAERFGLRRRPSPDDGRVALDDFNDLRRPK